jgi:ABC-type branched-subunit amino acid transport system substrate-binding protein
MLLILLILVLQSCADSTSHSVSTPGVTDTEIRLGSSSALTGHASFLGTQYSKGSLAYFQKVNAEGGIHGRSISLIQLDDQYDPDQCFSNTEKLIDDPKIFMLFDYVGTPTSVRTIELIQEAKMPALGYLTGAEQLRTPFRPYMFHVRDSYFAEAEGAVAYFADTLDIKNIGVMYQNDAFGQAVLTGVQLALQRRGMQAVGTATYERGSLEVSAAMEDLRSSGAAAIVLVGTYGPLAKAIRICHDHAFYPFFHTVSFVGSEAFSRELIEVQNIQPDQYERIIVTQVVPSPTATNLPTVREFRDDFADAFPGEELNYVALEGYINARVLAHALELAGPTLSRESVIRALESIRDLDLGISKNLSYGPTDRKGLSGIYYSRLNPQGIFETFDR